NLGQCAVRDQVRHRLPEVIDHLGRALEGVDPERIFALDREEIGELPENNRELLIRHGIRFLGALTPWPVGLPASAEARSGELTPQSRRSEPRFAGSRA